MSDSEGVSAAVRERIFDAVLAELAESGIDEFTIDRVARRVGVDPAVLYARWRDRRVLLMEAMIARADQLVPVPDTGSLSEDLRGLSTSIMKLAETELGRQWFHRLLPGGRDADLSEVGSDFWAVRIRAGVSMFQRAADRGELRAGIDIGEATRMVIAAIYYDLIFNDTPVRPEYAAQLREILLYGFLAPHIHDESLIKDFQNREDMRALLRATTDAMLDPVALVEAVRDDDGRITDFTFREANPAACAYLQRSRDELIGGSMKATLPDIESSGMLARYVDCVQTGEPVAVENFAYFSQRYQEMRRYDLRGARAGTDLLSMTWRDVTERVEANREIVEAKERYRLLVLNSADAVLHVREGIAVWVSPAIETMLGAPPEHWIGTRLRDVVPPEDIPAFNERWSVLDAGGTVQERVRVVAVDGVTHWVQLHAKPFYDAEGHRDGTSAALRLVDDEVAAEQQLNEARRAQAAADALYRRSMESAAVGMCLASRAGSFLRVNQALCEFFGYDAETLLTKTWIELTAPEYLDADLANAAELVAGRIESYQMKKQFIHADGHRIWGHLSVGCLRNSAGSVAMTIGQIVDITTEVEAQRAAAVYQQAMEASNIGINIVRPDGPVVWINQAMCDIFGIDVETAMQKTWQETTPPENMETNLRVVEDLMAGRVEVVRTTQHYFRANGQKVWLDVSVKCLSGADGRPEYILTQMLDITDRVQAQQQLATELDNAARYLKSILPGELSGPVAVSSRYLPSRQVGGDCYDYRWIDPDHLIVYLFDVSGQGVDAALLAVSVHNVLRSGSMPRAMLLEPHRVLAELNRLFPMEHNDEHYLTMWFGVYQVSTRLLRYSTAGHPPALALSFDGDHPSATALSTHGKPVGMFADPCFTTAAYKMPHGGQLLVYSDGLLDLAEADTDRPPDEVLVEMCTDPAVRPNLSLQTLLDTLGLQGTGEQPDDCSLVLLTVD